MPQPTPPALDRWTAVQRRDAAADGSFVYSVASTGIYCRPSCPSRAARAEHVAFHPTAQAAEAAGFRACLRCRPNDPAPADRHAAAIAAACRLIDVAEAQPSLDALARAAGLSRFHFHRVFRSVTGVTPKAFAAARRAERLRGALTQTATITEAIHGSGYAASNRFYAEAAHRLGMRPTTWRDGGRGETIWFAVGACSLGPVLVAATKLGFCAIQFGETQADLVRALRDRFPNAALCGDDPGFGSVVGQVFSFVDRPAGGLALPLDIRGTAFQARVWAALAAIPPGAAASYAGIAAGLGKPRAARAVAQACAANRLAVAIPCHRVVRTDGTPGGYRWGVARKRALLEREG